MASYKNESNLTKAIKLSRLSETSMVCLLLNALTECNYHAEVKKLEVILDAPQNYWTDKRTSKMAIDLATKLNWDASAVSRVIANASKDKEIPNALKKVGLYGGKLASAKKHYEEMMAKFRLPRLDRTRYTDLSDQGLEGPFIFKGGEVLYYDPKAGKYYDRDTDMYLSDRDADRITSAYRNASALRVAKRYIQAGSGLKSIQAIIPGTSDRQANHLLHALSASILDGDIASKQDKVIKGEIEVESNSSIHPSSPSYPEPEMIDGVVGMTSKMKLKVDLKDLEKLAKMKLYAFYPPEDNSTKFLCDAITKNIENNILRNMDIEELDLAFGEPQYDVEQKLPEYHSISNIEVVEYDYEVKDIFRENDRYLTVIVVAKIEYDVVAEFDRDSFDKDRY